jgi:hypothetical protein
MKFSILAFLYVSQACAGALQRRPLPFSNELKADDTTLANQSSSVPPSTFRAEFQQYIDHADPSIGTFTQRYVYNADYWKGPGSPIVFTTDGESTIDFGFDGTMAPLTEFYTTVVLAQKIGAAVINFETRYFGNSTPVANLSTPNMVYNTPENTIADFINFARNADLPFDSSGKSNAPTVPWIFVGGSMPGAFVSWTEYMSPGTFWAYWASSATSEGIDSDSYTIPILEHANKNCTSDVVRVVAHIDSIAQNGTIEEQQNLKASFGLEHLNMDDFGE